MTSRSVKNRGISGRPAGRFATRVVNADAGLDPDAPPQTTLTPMRARDILTRNQSPDIPFDRSINPYQGCEHGCVYCYARPSHSYLDLSPGIDFESRIFYKPNAVESLLAAWQRPAYSVRPVTIGANTDPYQPAERKLRLTRNLLETFLHHRHPVSLITKGTLIERDIDLLSELASLGLCSVAVSIPTTDDALKRVLEPRVPAASRRYRLVRTLAASGVPVSVMMAPVIPALNDGEIEDIVDQAATAGAESAAWILLRLPHEVGALFRDWLHTHFPARASRVMSLLRQSGGGRDYDNRFGFRQTGTGPYAEMIAQRFRAACRRAGLKSSGSKQELDCTQFIRPGASQYPLPL